MRRQTPVIRYSRLAEVYIAGFRNIDLLGRVPTRYSHIRRPQVLHAVQMATTIFLAWALAGLLRHASTYCITKLGRLMREINHAGCSAD